VDCDLKMTGAIHGARFAEEARLYKILIDSLNQMGLNPDGAEFWDAKMTQERLKSSFWKGAFLQPVAGQFWPAKFCWAVAKVRSCRIGDGVPSCCDSNLSHSIVE
jgi:glycine/D-amino acid oxidase-like deaminating enzyme